MLIKVLKINFYYYVKNVLTNKTYNVIFTNKGEVII